MINYFLYLNLDKYLFTLSYVTLYTKMNVVDYSKIELNLSIK